ncbi:PREDICTED: uncharacterized protein LOC109337846, partial [Lupinus angustifolius]|uniref:uncharacterized protein LOC109337846 n=1 Tax=Lupinus angustifolius TaxID=3871 RepID=UPI00092F623C
MPPPINIKDVRSFLGHARFYHRFIKDYSKIAKPLSNLVMKDTAFDFSVACLESFCRLKEALVTTLILQSPYWNHPFEEMCDANDYIVKVVLGQKKDKKMHAIYYASKTLDGAQANYATTKKELLAVVFAFEKFRKGTNNPVADHLSRLEHPSGGEEDLLIDDSFPDEQLLLLDTIEAPWYADFVNYLVSKIHPSEMTPQRCVPEEEVSMILSYCHFASYGGHTSTSKTIAKIIFPRFGVLRLVISDGGSHFIKRHFENLFKKYGVTYRVGTPYQPQISGKWKYQIMRLRAYLVSRSRKDWSLKLDDALWGYRTAHKTAIGKLKSRWSGSFRVTNVYPYRTVEIWNEEMRNFK